MKKCIILLCILLVIFLLYSHVEEYYSQLDPHLPKIKDLLIQVHPEASNLEIYEGNKSYSINKQKIYLCLKDENNKYYSKNTLVYVALHELAHCINKKDIGHSQSFNEIFDQLLKRATALGIYNPNIPIPPDYCEY